MKESGSLDLDKKLKKLRNLKMTEIKIVFGALGTLPKGLEKRLGKLEIRRRIEIIQTTALFISARIVRRVLEAWGYVM